MPVKGKDQVINEDGQPHEAFTIDFTNGAKEQLSELKEYFKALNLTEVVKLGVSMLQKMKEIEEGKNKGETGSGK
jgi:hypothetical protein